jgi:hypothetical protein
VEEVGEVEILNKEEVVVLVEVLLLLQFFQVVVVLLTKVMLVVHLIKVVDTQAVVEVVLVR